MKLLILYGTTEGQTRKIARFLKEEAEKQGHEVTLSDTSDQPPLPAGFNKVVIASSIHIQKYQSAVAHYVKENAEALNKVPCAFYSVSLTAAGDDKESWAELEKITTHFLQHTGWKPQIAEQVAGALLYTQYDFFKKFVMRMIAKRAGGNTDTSGDYEYTDWAKLKTSFNRFLTAE